ncbi:MAG: DEAD/DEAH box helicase family protein [Methanomicrobiales archaeon]|jgi:type I restriction enzyme R subunit|nr:DEAD/DEAH box helicase family protein [Methanomicrobiales archaeon]
MPTNFDFLTTDPQFSSFADTAVQAELVLSISPNFCATGCRAALEFAVKWMYSVDQSLTKPYDDSLAALVGDEKFCDLLPADLLLKIRYIRKLGNNATHNPRSVTADQVVLSLQNLHSFMGFIAHCYGTDYQETAFDTTLLTTEKSAEPVADSPPPIRSEIDFDTLIHQNIPKREELTARRKQKLKQGYAVKPMDFTEAQTRRAYIDVMLEDAGWQRGKNWRDEYQIDEMPNKSGFGKADYVLFGDDGLPLAVIEAKRTSRNVEEGRQQAVLYVDFLEKKYGQRPIIFLTNGYEISIWNDKYYPERTVSGIYSKRDLEKEFNKIKDRKPLKAVQVNDEISNRYYQKEAIQAVCETLGERNRRKALLVMATGSGKTRTVISIVDVLIRHGWVKNILFLADRSALVTQAKRAFHNLMPNLSLCNLSENKADASARAVFSTYQTMINCIDDTRDDQGERLFTTGHFDLIIVDEAHRSIYNRYKDIFTYFDALLVGLTATPKDEIDKNTYEIFDLESGVPTYGYELSQAVQDGYLVDFVSIESELKFISQGITYDDLTPEEKVEYEKTFSDEDGNVPPSIESSALNEWLFNYDTIKKALHILMKNGQHIDFNTKIGKTIIFAKSHNHAEKILEVWNKEFPDYPSHYCRVIDNYTNYAQSLIDDFSDPKKYPQIAVSVDMLDTGIDVPEILNLVFFKKVFSRAKFWQMVGRGTRLCEGLIDGEDKKQFYIFDLCGNFSFFRLNTKGRDAGPVTTLQERMFNTKVEMVRCLQELAFQTDELKDYRTELVRNLAASTQALNRDNFSVKQHLRAIDQFQNEDDFTTLTYENTVQIAEHIAPLIPPMWDKISTARFDMLLYQIELSLLAGKSYKKAKNDLIKKASELSRYANIPAVAAQKEIIEQILHTDFLEQAGIMDYEDIRRRLRDLIDFIPSEERSRYDTNFTDDILSQEWNESQLDNDDLANYKKKVNYYISQHQDIPVIAKLKGNVPLMNSDVKELEQILWSELGTKEQYDEQYGQTPLGELVRSIVGLSRQAANDSFSMFMNNYQLDSRQMHFVKQIVNYIVTNGMMKDLAILQESPFSDMGSVSEIFDEGMIMDLREMIQRINENAVAMV